MELKSLGVRVLKLASLTVMSYTVHKAIVTEGL